MAKVLSHLAAALAASAMIVAAPHSVAAQNDLNADLDKIDCTDLRIDYVRMMPEMVEPKPLTPPDPPFSEASIKQLGKSAALDPSGLCHYRDANRILPKPTSARVVFIGDSITEYWRLADRDLFSGDVLDRGVSGQSTGQMLARFQQDVIALHPRVVHIMGGINDAMAPNGTASTRANVVSMVELARAHGIKVVLGGLTPADRFRLVPDARLAPFVAEHNRWLRAYAMRQGIAFVDYHTALVGPDGAITPAWSNDGLHPNRLGYQRIASLIRTALRQAKSR